LALRESPGLDWRRWIVRQALIGTALGWMGPFGTFVGLALPERLVFWIADTVLIGLCARLCIRAIGRIPGADRLSLTQRVLAGALLSGFPGTLIVVVMLSMFGIRQPKSLSVMAETYASIAACVMLFGVPMARLAQRQALAQSQAASASPSDQLAPQSAFLRRLSPRLGTDLLHLAAEDHYVRAATRLGEELVLCRLSDATAELPEELGRRVHRSHWVARSAIIGSEKKAGKVELILANGTVVPVSETYLPDLRAAGWIKV
jgi:hypothetical protein